jgi:DNA-binding MarR family transcriptional regulator
MAYDFETSKPAYEEAKQNINEKQARVLIAIKELEICTDADIAKHLNWPINRVTPRRGELVLLNLVKRNKKGLDTATNRTVNFWEVN